MIPDWSKIDRAVVNLAGDWIGLGDVIAVSPLISAIRSAASDCKIYLVLTGTKWNQVARLIKGNPGILNVKTDFYRYRKLFFHGLLFRRPWLRTAYFYDYMAPRERASLLGNIMGAEFRFGYGPDKEEKPLYNTHILNYKSVGTGPFCYSDEFNRITGLKCTSTVSLEKKRLNGKRKRLINSLGFDSNTKLFALHPGSSSGLAVKRWPVESFARLAQELNAEYGITSVVILGPNELSIRENWPEESPVVFLEGAPIYDVACVLSACSYLISNDSGLMNLGFSLGVPGIGLFGPTDSARHNGWYPNGSFIQSRYNSTCPSCYGSDSFHKCNEVPPACMKAITVNEVLSKIGDLMRKCAA